MFSSVKRSRAADSFSRSVLTITLFAREKAPVPVAVSQIHPIAQLQAERFLFLEQHRGFLQSAPVLHDPGLVPVARLQTVRISKLRE
jgi:hypothetical protein